MKELIDWLKLVYIRRVDRVDRVERVERVKVVELNWIELVRQRLKIHIVCLSWKSLIEW